MNTQNRVRRVLTVLLLTPMVALSLQTPLHAGDPLRKVAKTLAKGMSGIENKKICVLSFPYHDGSTSSGSTIISERLTTYLAGIDDVQVVERSLLYKALEEMEFQQISVVDQATAKKLGQFLGVEALVTGSLIDQKGETTEVNARVIQADTGEILAAQRVLVKRTWADAPRKKIVPAPPAAMPPAEKDTADAAGSPEPVWHISNKNLPQRPPSEVPSLDELEGVERDPQRQPLAIDKARQIYVRARRPEVRARALLILGKLHEQRNEIPKARHAYHQLIREFPRLRPLVREAHERLKQLP